MNITDLGNGMVLFGNKDIAPYIFDSWGTNIWHPMALWLLPQIDVTLDSFSDKAKQSVVYVYHAIEDSGDCFVVFAETRETTSVSKHVGIRKDSVEYMGYISHYNYGGIIKVKPIVTKWLEKPLQSINNIFVCSRDEASCSETKIAFLKKDGSIVRDIENNEAVSIGDSSCYVPIYSYERNEETNLCL